MLECDRCVVGDRDEQRSLFIRERRVAVADELADLAPLPAQRKPHVVRPGATFRPGDVAVLEHERRAGSADGLHRRLHDRLERLLEVERLGDRLRDLRQGLELGDPALRLCVQLCVLNRLRDLVRDRDEQLDLVLRELARRERAHVQRAGELVARKDRHRENRLVVVLRQVRELLEARIEMRLRRNHHGRPVGCGGSRDSFARPQPRAFRHLLDARSMRGPEDELVRALVVEVDEAGLGPEGVGDLAGDQLEHLFEVERRVHRGDRLGEKA